MANNEHSDDSPARLLVTPGEPAGIGAEILLRAAQRPHAFELIAVADLAWLEGTANRLALSVDCHPWSPGQPRQPHRTGALAVWHHPLAEPPQPGVPLPGNARALLDSLADASRLCLDEDHCALVTGPMDKGVINDAGIPFTGHTEFLARLAERLDGGNGEPVHPVMMLVGGGLRVALATTHLPLRAVADAITVSTLERTLAVLHRDLQRHFGLVDPRIGICGLNPHAGEGGHLGKEEQTVLLPVITRFREQGMALLGPLPADTVFTRRTLQRCDAVLAMYHDQGLPVLKYAGFGKAVNVTLGLPFVRTSVDHGTGYDLAASGGADEGSLLAALTCAREMLDQH